jgi:predicted nuclease with TOPRIM domain
MRLQELHNELRQKKEERKKLKESIKDELKHHARYGEVVDEMTTLKAEKKSIETQVRESVPQDARRLADLDAEIKADEELMSDLAMNLILKNESVELRDEYENRYVPLMKVVFKKDDGTLSQDE